MDTVAAERGYSVILYQKYAMPDTSFIVRRIDKVHVPWITSLRRYVLEIAKQSQTGFDHSPSDIVRFYRVHNHLAERNAEMHQRCKREGKVLNLCAILQDTWVFQYHYEGRGFPATLNIRLTGGARFASLDGNQADLVGADDTCWYRVSYRGS